jgi:hypothetical protein
MKVVVNSDVGSLNKQIISGILANYYNTLALVVGQIIPEQQEEAEQARLEATRKFAKTAFPDTSIDIE